MNTIILVNEHDEQIGTEEKLIAHQKGLLHRAFSVILYRKREGGLEILLQQRQKSKYHCGGLWTNTCCSHPRPGESVLSAAKRRLMEEMGIEAELTEIGVFTYKAVFDNGLTEHEIDHVLIGECHEEAFNVNPEEVMDTRWITLADLKKELLLTPLLFTPWLKPAMDMFTSNL